MPPAASLRAIIRRIRSAGPLRPSRKPMPRQAQPDAIALEYFKALRKRAVDPALAAFADVRGEILRLLVDLREEQKRGDDLRTDAPSPQANAARVLVERAASRWADKWKPTALHDLAARFGKQTSDFQRAQFDRQIRAAVGVPYSAIEKPIRDLVPLFAKANTELVKSVPSRYWERLAREVEEAFAGGMQAETLAARFVELDDMTANDARRLANDQILTLAADVNQARQEALGVTRAVWETAQDMRVCDICAPRQGMIFDWDDPPDGCAPGHCHPGDRCYAAPILSDLLGN